MDYFIKGRFKISGYYYIYKRPPWCVGRFAYKNNEEEQILLVKFSPMSGLIFICTYFEKICHTHNSKTCQKAYTKIYFFSRLNFTSKICSYKEFSTLHYIF